MSTRPTYKFFLNGKLIGTHTYNRDVPSCAGKGVGEWVIACIDQYARSKNVNPRLIKVERKGVTA